jgi:hypothetical protein
MNFVIIFTLIALSFIAIDDLKVGYNRHEKPDKAKVIK